MLEGPTARAMGGREWRWDFVLLAHIGARLVVALELCQVDGVA